MRQIVIGCALLAGLLVTAASAWARVPMTRTEGQRNPGVRGDQFVPYLTTGTTAFGSYFAVPRVVSSPIVSDPLQPGSRKVYNIIFQGGVHEFGGSNEGAARR